MKKTVISAVLLAAIALSGCNAATPAETSAPAESTTTVASESSEESKDTEATGSSEDTSASEESKAPDGNNVAGYGKYKAVTDAVKPIVDSQDFSAFEEYGDPTGIMEVACQSENPYKELKYALVDLDKDGTEELFIVQDIPHEADGVTMHEISVLSIFTIDDKGEFVNATSGWARNRLQYLKDGSFYRRGSASADTVVVEFQKYDPEKKLVLSTECYYTTGETDADGNTIMYKAKNPSAPAFDGSDENVGAYEEFQLADDIVTFDDGVFFDNFYGEN
ncbi:MAG: hypothetical protein J5715_06665 [Clostridiales bacterium]|nr:hypothetical protein [Clostridiales bacterium]